MTEQENGRVPHPSVRGDNSDDKTDTTSTTLSSSSSSSSSSSGCCSLKCWLNFLRRNILLILLLIGIGAGIGMGAGLSTLEPPMSKRDLMYFKFPGDLFMRMLKALIIPLIVSSLVTGLAGLESSASGRMGLFAIVYYLSTTLIAVILGIVLVITIEPGYNSDVSNSEESGEAEPANIADSFLDLLRNMFPDNIVEACFRQTKTTQIPVYGYVNETTEMNVTNILMCDNDTLHISSMNEAIVTCNVTQNVSTILYYDFSIDKEDGMNILGLVVFSVALGIVVSMMGPVGKPLTLFCQALSEATMKLVIAVIWYSPIGIMFLIAGEIINMEDPIKELEALALYMATVLAGLAIHGIIILPLIYLVIVRSNPLRYLSGLLQALLTAFGTASSTATLPVTYRCLEVNNRIDPRVTRFLLPVGATINMDGTALYEAVAAIFIAQSNGMSLNFAEIVAISITATLASIGAASVPQAGLVTMVIVLSVVGLPAEEVSKIIAVDWLLDRFRTTVNVEGDAIGAAVVSHLCRKQLAAAASAEENTRDINLNNYAEVSEKGEPNVNIYMQDAIPSVTDADSGMKSNSESISVQVINEEDSIPAKPDTSNEYYSVVQRRNGSSNLSENSSHACSENKEVENSSL